MTGRLSPAGAARRRRILRLARRPVTLGELERLARQHERGSRDLAARGLKVRAAVRSLVRAGCLSRTGPGLRTTAAGEAHYAELAGL